MPFGFGRLRSSVESSFSKRLAAAVCHRAVKTISLSLINSARTPDDSRQAPPPWRLLWESCLMPTAGHLSFLSMASGIPEI